MTIPLAVSKGDGPAEVCRQPGISGISGITIRTLAEHNLAIDQARPCHGLADTN
jgi:hypothetical protein